MKTEYGGRLYHSKREAEYAAELDLLKKSGIVYRWFPQMNYDLHVNGKKVAKYILDFWVDYNDGKIEAVDVKGFETALFKLKKKMFEAEYGLKIKIVR